MDIMDLNDKYEIIAEIPGMDESSIDIKAVSEKEIIIEGTLLTGRQFSKRIPLPGPIHATTIKFEVNNEILDVVVEKKSS